MDRLRLGAGRRRAKAKKALLHLSDVHTQPGTKVLVMQYTIGRPTQGSSPRSWHCAVRLLPDGDKTKQSLVSRLG